MRPPLSVGKIQQPPPPPRPPFDLHPPLISTLTGRPASTQSVLNCRPAVCLRVTEVSLRCNPSPGRNQSTRTHTGLPLANQASDAQPMVEGEGVGVGGGGVSSITAAGTDGEQLLWMEMCFDDGDVLQCSLHLQLCCHCYALASCPEQWEECSLLLVTALFIRAAPQDPLNISRQLKYFIAQLM